MVRGWGQGSPKVNMLTGPSGGHIRAPQLVDRLKDRHD